MEEEIYNAYKARYEKRMKKESRDMLIALICSGLVLGIAIWLIQKIYQ